MKAEFSIPQMLFDSFRGNLTDGFVSVVMSGAYDGSDNGSPDFLGYLDVDNSDLGPGQDGVTMSAQSITGYLNKVGIGDGDDDPVLKYPLINPYNGEPTEWTPLRILEDLFKRLPDRYRDRVRLGKTAVLDTTTLTNLPDLEFRLGTYAKAIDDVLAMFGDVTFTERFNGETTYLDFYRIQAAGSPTARVQIAEFNDVVTSGADIESFGHEQSVNDAITRVKAYGTKKRYILSITNYGENIDANLVFGWNPALNAAVLRDPKSAKPGSPGYVPGMENVARRYYLPAALKPYMRLKNLGIRRAPVGDQEGPFYKVQVWKFPTILTLQEDGSALGEEATTPQLIKNVKLELDEGYFELANTEDGLNIAVVEDSDDGKGQKTTWQQAKIGITLCVEGRRHLVADTGAETSSGIRLDIAQDGLYDRLIRDDLTYVQLTNVGTPTPSPAGVDCEWPVHFFNEDTGVWSFFPEMQVVQDDSEKLMTVAREHLRARNKRHHVFSGKLPYFSRAFRPGYRLLVAGHRNLPRENMTITGVIWDLEGNSTSVTADNVKPPRRRDARV